MKKSPHQPTHILDVVLQQQGSKQNNGGHFKAEQTNPYGKPQNSLYARANGRAKGFMHGECSSNVHVNTSHSGLSSCLYNGLVKHTNSHNYCPHVPAVSARSDSL